MRSRPHTPRPAGDGGQRPAAHARGDPIDHRTTSELARALDTWDGPGVLVIAGNLFDLTGCAAPRPGHRTMEAHPVLPRRHQPVPGRGRAASHPPDRHPEPGYDTDPEMIAAIAARGVEQLGPVDLHLQTATGVRVVRIEPGEHAYAPGCSGRRDRVRPGSRRQARGGRPCRRRPWLALAGRPVARRRTLAGRTQPAQRPVAPFAVRRLTHPVPAGGPLRLVAPGAVRRGCAPAGGGHPVGARSPRHRTAGAGVAPRPPGRPGRPDPGCRAGGPGRPGRPGRGTRAAQPSHVVDPRRWSPRLRRTEAGANDAARDAARRLVGRGTRA